VFFFEAHSLLRNFPEVDFVEKPARYTNMLIDMLLRGIRPKPCDRRNAGGPGGRSRTKRRMHTASAGKRNQS